MGSDDEREAVNRRKGKEAKINKPINDEKVSSHISSTTNPSLSSGDFKSKLSNIQKEQET